MCSFDPGPIFPASLGHDLSRNVVVVSVYAFQKKLYWSIGFVVTPKFRDFHDFSSFLEHDQGWSRTLPLRKLIRYCGNVFRDPGVTWAILEDHMAILKIRCFGRFSTLLVFRMLACHEEKLRERNARERQRGREREGERT